MSKVISKGTKFTKLQLHYWAGKNGQERPGFEKVVKIFIVNTR